MRTKIKRTIAIILSLLLISVFAVTDVVTTYAGERLPEQYIQDNTNSMISYDSDVIGNIGKELDVGNVKLIIVINKKSLNSNPMTDIKNSYFTWISEVKDERLVVVYYYIDDKGLYIYDDGKGYVDDSTLASINSQLSAYNDHKDISAGILYTYSSVAEKIAKQSNITLHSANSTPKYKVKFNISLPAIFGLLIFVIILFSFRRKNPNEIKTK